MLSTCGDDKCLSHAAMPHGGEQGMDFDLVRVRCVPCDLTRWVLGVILERARCRHCGAEMQTA